MRRRFFHGYSLVSLVFRSTRYPKLLINSGENDVTTNKFPAPVIPAKREKVAAKEKRGRHRVLWSPLPPAALSTRCYQPTSPENIYFHYLTILSANNWPGIPAILAITALTGSKYRNNCRIHCHEPRLARVIVEFLTGQSFPSIRSLSSPLSLSLSLSLSLFHSFTLSLWSDCAAAPGVFVSVERVRFDRSINQRKYDCARIPK